MPNREITVISRAFDRTIRRTWQCSLVECRDSRIELSGVFEREVHHPGLGIIAAGTISNEYFWLDRWYNVFRFCEPDGTLRNYYCNVACPPTFGENVLDYIDLDLDVVAWPDGRVEILDEQDFDLNSEIFNYPEDVRATARTALEDVLELIKNREFPFETDPSGRET
jgi:protein associated with RNAse G/E